MDKQAIVLLVVTLVVSAGVWAGFSFWQAQANVTVDAKAVSRSSKITPEFDLEPLVQLQERVEAQNYDINELKKISENNPKFRSQPSLDIDYEMGEDDDGSEEYKDEFEDLL